MCHYTQMDDTDMCQDNLRAMEKQLNHTKCHTEDNNKCLYGKQYYGSGARVYQNRYKRV